MSEYADKMKRFEEGMRLLLQDGDGKASLDIYSKSHTFSVENARLNEKTSELKEMLVELAIELRIDNYSVSKTSKSSWNPFSNGEVYKIRYSRYSDSDYSDS